MTMRKIVLIGAKEQCDLYPNIFGLLADASGSKVIGANTADAIAPASSIRNNSIFKNRKIISFNIHRSQ